MTPVRTKRVGIRRVARIETATLPCLVNALLGFQRGSNSTRIAVRRSVRAPVGGRISRMNDSQLWSLFEVCKWAYREKISRMHPDRGGKVGPAAELNAVWNRAKKLFGCLGIG